MSTYSALTIPNWPFVSGVSNLSNAVPVANNPMSGFLNAMNTVMMLKICKEDPDMYSVMKVMGSAFAGAKATS